MGTLSERTMVATKVLISLCVVGLARAAPQLGLPALPVPARGNQQVIVNDVVTALQPSIANAVAEALRGLQSSSGGFSSTSTITSSSSSNGFASGSGNAAGSSSGFSGSSNGFSGSSNAGFSGSGSGFSSGAAGASGSAELAGATRAEHNYQFQVADDDEQTYITQNEARDGDEVTGTYSYVDPNGDLITVNYQAGPMGYTQTLDKQVGAVQIRARPARTQAVSQSGSSANSQSGSSSFSSGSSFGSSGSSFGSQSGSSFGSQSGSSFGSQTGFSSTTSSSSGLDQSALIAQILSVLQPQISVAVNSAVAAQQ